MSDQSKSTLDPLTLDAIRTGGKRALSRALGRLESEDGSLPVARLLDEAARAANAHVVGLTGPPGVGKSTLTNALIRRWRAMGDSVGVVAVDPSSRFSQGALLGDRTRLDTDPRDQKIFVRSMAARDRLGGLSHEALSAIILMRALFDRVLVESVGIGQSEADIAFAVDSVVLCIQPGSGDSLQFMKAGVMELPDIVVVTKADMKAVATKAKADVEGALTLTSRHQDDWRVPVLLVCALSGEESGIDALVSDIDRHFNHGVASEAIFQRRDWQNRLWLADRVRRKFGTVGLSHVDLDAYLQRHGGYFEAERRIDEALTARLSDM